MKQRNSLILGWIFAGLCLLAFFLPWARFAPESVGTNALRLANSLASGEEDIISSYFWMRRDEVKAALRNPAEGYSGFQIVQLAGETGVHHLPRTFLQFIWGGENTALPSKVLLMIPVLALGGALMLTPAKPSSRQLLGTAAALAINYGWLRWKLNEAYTDRLLLQVELNLGLWLCLYASVALIVVMVIRALLPPKVKF